MKKLILVVALASSNAFSMFNLKEIATLSFSGRTSGKVTETVLRHQVSTRDGQREEWEERLVASKGKYFYLMRNGGRTFAGTVEGRGHVIAGKKFPINSFLFLKYIGGATGDEFVEQAISEGYLRRDLLQPFKNGYEAKGDPRTWPTAEYYIKHPEIFLSQPNGAVTAMGTSEGSRRKSVSFDPAFKGVAGWEFADGTQQLKWTFHRFDTFKGEGTFPRILTFDSEAGRVQSELVSRTVLSAKQVADFQSRWRASNQESGLSSSAELSLALLLSYR